MDRCFSNSSALVVLNRTAADRFALIMEIGQPGITDLSPIRSLGRARPRDCSLVCRVEMCLRGQANVSTEENMENRVTTVWN
jgi:hypothetical protein